MNYSFKNPIVRKQMHKYLVALKEYQLNNFFQNPILLSHADKMHDLDLIVQMEYDYSVDIV